jgi:hypothetical protein
MREPHSGQRRPGSEEERRVLFPVVTAMVVIAVCAALIGDCAESDAARQALSGALLQP